MNATDFIKKHGWSAVIEAVRTAPLDHDFQSTDLEPTFTKDGSAVYFTCKVHIVSHAAVKQLVESHELVEKLGGLERAKRAITLRDKKLGYTHVYLHSNSFYCFLDDRVDYIIPERAIDIVLALKAIADVEACQGAAQ